MKSILLISIHVLWITVALGWSGATTLAYMVDSQGYHHDSASLYDSKVTGVVTRAVTGRSARGFYPSGEYAYRVDGEIYHGNRCSSNRGGYYKYYIGSPLPLEYDVNDEVIVYYNSKDPREAVLFQGVPWFWPGISLALWISYAAFIFLRLRSSRIAQSGRREPTQ